MSRHIDEETKAEFEYALKQLHKEIEGLKDKIKDWEDAREMSLTPSHDEVHCGCVPLLKSIIKDQGKAITLCVDVIRECTDFKCTVCNPHELDLPECKHCEINKLKQALKAAEPFMKKEGKEMSEERTGIHVLDALILKTLETKHKTLKVSLGQFDAIGYEVKQLKQENEKLKKEIEESKGIELGNPNQGSIYHFTDEELRNDKFDKKEINMASPYNGIKAKKEDKVLCPPCTLNDKENKLKPPQHKFYELDCVCTEELYRCKLCGWITNKKEIKELKGEIK